jgi:hypothetical protein
MRQSGDKQIQSSDRVFVGQSSFLPEILYADWVFFLWPLSDRAAPHAIGEVFAGVEVAYRCRETSMNRRISFLHASLPFKLKDVKNDACGVHRPFA